MIRAPGLIIFVGSAAVLTATLYGLLPPIGLWFGTMLEVIGLLFAIFRDEV